MSIVTKILLVLVGVVFLSLAYFNRHDVDYFLADSEITLGKVIDFSIERSSPGARSVYYPLIEYSVNGKLLKVKHLRGTNPPEHAIGDIFEIIYQKSNPTNAKVNLPINIFGPVYIPAFLGVLFLILGVGRFPKAISNKISKTTKAFDSFKT